MDYGQLCFIVLQRTFLSWMYPIVNKGRKGKLEQAELRMPADQATEEASKKFDVSGAGVQHVLNSDW